MKVVVVGGGVLGQMTAYELSAYAQVVVVEQGQPGKEASWAGGGIVSPLYPWRYSPPVTALAVIAQAAYPTLVASLRAETEVDAELFQCGMLMLDAEDQRDAIAWGIKSGHQVVPLTGQSLDVHLPFLSRSFSTGLWMPGIANVRNPRLLSALLAALRKRKSVQVLSSVAVQSFICGGAACQGVELADGRKLFADHVVVCGGAWSGELLKAQGVSLPIRPVQGQMILYKTDPGTLPCMLMYQGRYLIPRRDGHVLCGSTLEDVGFNKHTSEAALQDLRASAEQLWPALEGVQPVRQWAGLRPASPNGIPFIGEVPGIKGLWVNAGQFRNGLVLAPASARLLVDLMLGREPIVDPTPYQVPAP